MFQIYSFYIDDFLTIPIHDELIALISNERINKIEKLRRADDKIRSLYSELLARYALKKEFNLEAEDIKFTWNRFSKPLLVGYEDIHFNLSHSDNWIVCAVGDSPLGVDVEKIELGDNRFIEEVLHLEEIEYIKRFKDNEKNTKYYTFWCLKEAYGKYMGVGLNYDYQKYSFHQSSQIWTLKSHKSDSWEPLYFQVKRLPGNYILAVCSPTTLLMKIKQISLQEVIDFNL